ncbi:hypothetical protein PVAP13_3KG274300 [Panicum virgatum]|uniref:Wall-associated receptor kinase galacturonan-binding domain-containing protein n=1 Tax=Panicum virgatum TaxID=38727 RepID=A0A8T0V407_PANVG|nr:hypothetical protein PVAP13_3KG274300 [Panicum virgatum]
MHASAVLVPLALLPLVAATLDATCAPASCGNLSITYPFWLRDHQPSYCGLPSFGVGCDPTGAPPIHYASSSVVVFHTNLAGDPSACRATAFNMSTGLALSLLAVSRVNWELFFFANCSRPPPAGSLPMSCARSGAWSLYLMSRSYEPGGPAQEVAAAGCHYSAVPVLPAGIRAEGAGRLRGARAARFPARVEGARGWRGVQRHWRAVPLRPRQRCECIQVSLPRRQPAPGDVRPR